MDKLDIKAKVEELVKKIGADEDLQKGFAGIPHFEGNDLTRRAF